MNALMGAALAGVCVLGIGCASGGGGTGGGSGGGGLGGGGGMGGGGGSGQGCTSVPPPVWQPSGTRVTWNGVSFIVPPGMTGTDRTTHYEISAAGQPNGTDTCSIAINMPTAPTGNLAQQASDLLTQAYSVQGYQVLDDNYGTDLIAHRTVGQSAKGWSYVELRAELRMGTPSAERGHLMLVNLTDRVVPLIGYSPTNAGCTQLDHDNTAGIIGELRWRQLEYSLEFTGPSPAPQSLVGHWSLFQGPSGQEYVFYANGRYQYWGGLTQAHVISNTEIELATSNAQGDGPYAVTGSVVTLCPDGRTAESFLYRLFEQHSVSPTGVVRAVRKLGLLKSDTAGQYEVAVEKL